MSKVQELAEAAKELKAEFQSKYSDIFGQVVKGLFDEHPGLNTVMVVGYTPGFNDGDPCTHSSYAEVDSCEMEESLGRYFNLEVVTENRRGCGRPGGYECGARDDVSGKYCGECGKLKVVETREPGMAKNELESQTGRDICKYLDQFADALENVYGTDWILMIRRAANDKGYIIEQQDYECGY